MIKNIKTKLMQLERINLELKRVKYGLNKFMEFKFQWRRLN
jgi:hypothetical protein